MERYDQHVHSSYSFDSQERLEDECEAALQRGLRGITFTEHFSVDPLDVSYGVLRYDAYRQAVTDCQKKYRGRLQIGCGLEILPALFCGGGLRLGAGEDHLHRIGEHTKLRPAAMQRHDKCMLVGACVLMLVADDDRITPGHTVRDRRMPGQQACHPLAQQVVPFWGAPCPSAETRAPRRSTPAVTRTEPTFSPGGSSSSGARDS